MNRIIFLSNSPGEVSGWVKPTAEELCELMPQAEKLLAVLPCPYASGSEKRYGATLSGIDRSMKYRELLDNLPADGNNLVLQLGGDPMFGALLSARLKCCWMIYTARPKFQSRVSYYFLPDKFAEEKRFADKPKLKGKYERVGNLILDSVPPLGTKDKEREKLGIEKDKTVVSFMPGSRPFEYKAATPFFCTAAGRVAEKFENCRFILPLAPTVENDILKKGLEEYKLTLADEDGEEIISVGNARIKVIRDDNFSAVRASDLVVALPGTNNLQTASIGTPLLMLAPLNYAEEIPLDGIAGLIPFNLPVFKGLKKKLVMAANKREKFLSLPNRISGEAIVPEYRQVMTPEMVADFIADLLENPEKLRKIADGYAKVEFEYGAAKKIAARVAKHFETSKN